jgi:hypothetical protein
MQPWKRKIDGGRLEARELRDEKKIRTRGTGEKKKEGM